jgi:hypothetical protein
MLLYTKSDPLNLCPVTTLLSVTVLQQRSEEQWFLIRTLVHR